MPKKQKKLFLTGKQVSKVFQSKAIEALSSAGAGVGGSLLLNVIRTKINNPDVQKITGRFGGLVFLAGGAGVSIYAANPILDAVGKGLITMGAMQSILDLQPNFGAQMSIASQSSVIEGISDEWQNFEDMLQLSGAEEDVLDFITEQDLEGIEDEAEKTEASDLIP